MLKTVAHAGQVLDLFTIEAPEWGPTAVAEVLGVSKSQAHELLVSLAGTGLLCRRMNGRYELGWRVASLHAILARTSTVKMAAQPALGVLAARHGATANLAVRDRGRVVYVDRRADRQASTIQTPAVGARLPGHGSAVGKQLLAACDEGELLSLLGEGRLQRFTPRTATSVDSLWPELLRVREDGIAVDRGETMGDLRCVAALLRDPKGDAVAALSISMPAQNWPRDHDQLAAGVLEAAAGIQGRMRAASGGRTVVGARG